MASDLGVWMGSWAGIGTGVSAVPSSNARRDGMLAGKCGV